MVKHILYKVGDIVSFHGKEYFVVKSNKKQTELITRNMEQSTKIKVKTKLLKKERQWRHRLTEGDLVCVYLGFNWVKAHVHSKVGDQLELQPVFTHTLFRCTIHFNMMKEIDILDNGVYPRWIPYTGPHKYVHYNGHIKVIRGVFGNKYLVHPWLYIPIAECTHMDTPFSHKPIGTYWFDMDGVFDYPTQIVEGFNSDELMVALTNRRTHVRNSDILTCISSQYAHDRVSYTKTATAYPSLDDFVDAAIDQGDTIRVSELLSITDHHQLYYFNKNAIHMHYSEPYIHPECSIVNGALKMNLHWTGLYKHTPFHRSNVVNILSALSTTEHMEMPMERHQATIEPDTPQYLQILTQQVQHMDNLTLSDIVTRPIHNLKYNLYSGISQPAFITTGGILNVQNIGEERIFIDAVGEDGQTIVVIEKIAMYEWIELCKESDTKFSIYHGSHRSLEGNIILTTKQTLINNSPAFVARECQRIVFACKIPAYCFTLFEDTVKRLCIPKRWILIRDANPPSASALRFLGIYPFTTMLIHGVDERDLRRIATYRTITMTRERASLLGCPLIGKKIRYVHCTETEDIDQLRDSARYTNTPSQVMDIVDKFSISKSLVKPHLFCEEISTPIGTVDTIMRRYKLPQTAKERLETIETCAICLGNYNQPTCTSCGHIYCKRCVNQLKSRGIKCPMCRTKITGFMEISDKDTPGNIYEYKGKTYIVPTSFEEGIKVQHLRTILKNIRSNNGKQDKIMITSKHTHVVKFIAKQFALPCITQSSSFTQCRKALQAFEKDKILAISTDALDNGFKCRTNHIIMLDRKPKNRGCLSHYKQFKAITIWHFQLEMIVS